MFVINSLKKNYKFIIAVIFIQIVVFVALDIYEEKTSPKTVHECVLKNALKLKSDTSAKLIVEACEKIFMDKDDCKKDAADSLCKKKIEESRFHGECAIDGINKAQSSAGAKLAFIYCETEAAHKVWRLNKD